MNDDVIERLSVGPVINANGHMTIWGGSIMHPEVVAAMSSASKHYVSIPYLLQRAGERIAELSGVEAAHITSGAAAGITVSVAACMAGTDDARLRQLPTTTGMRNEVVMQVIERNYYELMIRLAGARIVEIGMAAGKYRWPFPSWHLEAAINDATAAIISFPVYETENSLPLSEVIPIAKARGVPTIVDAADDYPSFGVLRKYWDMGAELTIISGGKGLRGPQSTGLILGDRELIAACAANSNPIHGVGRPMKVGKEEIAGIVRAVELASDPEREGALLDRMQESATLILERLGNTVAGLDLTVTKVAFHNGVPHIHIASPEAFDTRLAAVGKALLEDSPRIALEVARDRLVIHVNTLEPGEEDIVAERVGHALMATFSRDNT